MRRVINVLQSISIANSHIDDSCVTTFLNKIPDEIFTEILDVLKSKNINCANDQISKIIHDGGYSFLELVNRISDNLNNNLFLEQTQIQTDNTCKLIKGIGKLEYLLFSNVSINILILQLIGLFNTDK